MMSCLVPFCQSVPAVSLRRLPQNKVLANRWLQAIGTGCGLGAIDHHQHLDRLGVCGEHFQAPSDNASDTYQEPSRFHDSKGNLIEVYSCRLCLQFYPREDLSTNALWSEDTELLSVLCDVLKISPLTEDFTRLICLPCLARVEILKSLRKMYLESDRDFRNVTGYMQDYNLALQNEKSYNTCIMEQKVFSNPKESPNRELTISILRVESINNLTEKDSKSEAKSYRCRHCEESFSLISDLNSHASQTHGDETPHMCPECKKCFRFRHNLLKHQNYMHKNVKRPVFESHQNRAKCKLCNETQITTKQLAKHIKLAHPTESYPLVQCPDCPRTFTSRHQMNRHKQIHTDRFACEQCGEKHVSGQRLKAHVERHHLKQGQQFLCAECPGKTFSCSESLRVHLVEHVKEKPFVCEHCQKAFARKSKLECHIKAVHLGIKSYQCPGCKRAFGFSPNLWNHKRTCSQFIALNGGLKN
ncbi:zinc finger protein 708-like [Uranotaenia lowii]|uniref:zinc finger protein 708-like n=1 Tax=Uranotaenia lowii TaxID=190385 RepID=UPI002478ACFE|nr:zinc finger protein 708-like [Uranotaenia lowii]XP_055585749.1 zinc finger protein 708-like [Uranotaenia lowii]